MPRKKKPSRHRRVRYVGSADAIKKRDEREAEYKERRAADRDRARNIKAYRGGDSESDSESSEEAAALSKAQMAALRRGMKSASLGGGGGRGAAAPEEEDRVFKPKSMADRLGMETANLNANKKTHIKVSEMGAAPVQLSRREREEIAKQKSHADYMRRHANLETVQAKKDMMRLKMIREQRAKAKQRREEKEAADKERAERAEASAAAAEAAPKKFKKLTNREIKAMKPPKLKEELKKRGASIQGNKKALIKRLIDMQ